MRGSQKSVVLASGAAEGSKITIVHAAIASCAVLQRPKRFYKGYLLGKYSQPDSRKQ